MGWSVLWLMACGAEPVAEATAGGAAPPARVEVAAVTEGAVDERWSLVGEVVALDRAELAAGAAGPVDRVTVREGDPVQAGATLLQVDPSLAEASLAQARATQAEATAARDLAVADLARLERVTPDRLAPIEIDTARARAASAEARRAAGEASVDHAAAELGRHRVVAPFDGVVLARRVDPGDWVQPGQTVLEVLSTQGVEVRVGVPVEVASQVQEGVTVGLPGGEGTVLRVVPAADDATRAALVRIRPASGEGLVPGASVAVSLPVAIGSGLIVPRDAVVRGAAGDRVFTVADGTATARPVHVVASGPTQVLVTGEGVAPGVLVVTRGNERLRPGQAVDVVAGP